ncbi:MAG: SRPBCC family protein [Planktomarina sp.]
MSELILDRYLDHPPAKVFTFITDPDLVLKWWGPEYVTRTRGEMDFSKPGPWRAEMSIEDGRTVTVSGQVFTSEPVERLSYTWAWHTDGVRGHESIVHFKLSPKGAGTMLQLIHTDLPDEDAQTNHCTGWTSTLNCLEKFSKTN